MTATLDRRADYVSAVAVELGDLPAEERAELIEELDDHVAALLEDRPDADLVAELGTPRAYAAELRTAAGLTGGAAPRTSLAGVVARSRAWTRQVEALVPARVRPYLGAARTGWWVLRGYLLVAFLAVWWGGSTTWRVPFVPSFQGNWVLGGVLTVGAVVASVRLGQHRPTALGWRVAVIALDVVAIWCAFMVAASFRTQPESVYDTQFVPNCPVELDNLYAYDASGKPLDGVRLYDQYGTPFDIGTFGCNVGGQFTPGPGGSNAYPWPSYTYGQDAAPTGPPSSLAPLPGATVSPGTTSSGSPAASATPAAPSATPSPTATS